VAGLVGHPETAQFGPPKAGLNIRCDILILTCESTPQELSYLMPHLGTGGTEQNMVPTDGAHKKRHHANRQIPPSWVIAMGALS
jgi:hypothetical protein